LNEANIYRFLSFLSILLGNCCATNDGVFLDCCEVLPDECLEGASGDCNLMSAVQYLAQINQSSAPDKQAFILLFVSLAALAAWTMTSL